jgi:hypothetical protein
MVKGTREYLESCYTLLGKTSAEVFPIHFVSDLDVVGDSITGSINAFLYLDSQNGIVGEIR